MSSRSIRIALLGLHLALPANAKLRGEDDEATAMMLTDIKKKMENAGEYMTDKFMNAGEYLENQLGNDDEFEKNAKKIEKKFNKIGKSTKNAGIKAMSSYAYKDKPNTWQNKLQQKAEVFAANNKIVGMIDKDFQENVQLKIANDVAKQAQRDAEKWDKKVQDLMDKHGKKAGIVAAIAIAATVAYQYRAPLWRAIKKASSGIKKGAKGLKNKAVALKKRIFKSKQAPQAKQTTKLT